MGLVKAGKWWLGASDEEGYSGGVMRAAPGQEWDGIRCTLWGLGIWVRTLGQPCKGWAALLPVWVPENQKHQTWQNRKTPNRSTLKEQRTWERQSSKRLRPLAKPLRSHTQYPDASCYTSLFHKTLYHCMEGDVQGLCPGGGWLTLSTHLKYLQRLWSETKTWF